MVGLCHDGNNNEVISSAHRESFPETLDSRVYIYILRSICFELRTHIYVYTHIVDRWRCACVSTVSQAVQHADSSQLVAGARRVKRRTCCSLFRLKSTTCTRVVVLKSIPAVSDAPLHHPPIVLPSKWRGVSRPLYRGLGDSRWEG